MNLDKTQIKLLEFDENGRLIGFITRHPRTGKLKGVREDSVYGKKVCVVSDHLRGSIKPNVLYDVAVKPMYNDMGYVIVEAKEVLFNAYMDVRIIPGRVYRINIRFGNKTVCYNPVNGRTPSSNTLSGVFGVLDSRTDIRNKSMVLSNFLEEASGLLERMVKDGVIRQVI